MKFATLMMPMIFALAMGIGNAQTNPGPRNFGPPILGPDDKPAFPPAPAEFDKPQDGIAHGTVETLDYDSKSVFSQRIFQR
jgi:hypothetical protein